MADISVDASAAVQVVDGGPALLKTSAAILLGGPGVTATGATKGFPLASTDGIIRIPAVGHPLFAICPAAGSATVSVLQ